MFLLNWILFYVVATVYFQVLLQEVTSMKDEINKLKKLSKVVIEKAGKDINSSEILKNLEVIESRHHSLKTNLEERYTSFSASYKIISVFKVSIANTYFTFGMQSENVL